MNVVLHSRAAAAAALVAAGACASPTARAHPDTAPSPARARSAAALDSATARRICASPDSVVASRAPCVLRNQAPPIRVF